MNTPTTYTTIEGIIIRLFASGDSDAIIRVISQNEGKITIFAPRARKNGSGDKQKPSLDIFDWGIFETHTGKGNLLNLKAFHPRSSFHHLRDNFEKLILATFICEAFDIGIPDELPEDTGDSFNILWETLNKLNQAQSLKESFRITYDALAELLKMNGVLSNLEPPSTHAMLRLASQLEHYTGKGLSTKAELKLAIDSLKKE